MTRTDVYDFLLCRELILPFLPDQSTCNWSYKNSGFLAVFSPIKIPPLILLQVFGCGLSRPYLFYTQAKTYSKNYYTILWRLLLSNTPGVCSNKLAINPPRISYVIEPRDTSRHGFGLCLSVSTHEYGCVSLYVYVMYICSICML